MEPQGTLPLSKVSGLYSCPKPDQSTPRLTIPFLENPLYYYSPSMPSFFPSGLFPSGLSTTALSASILSPKNATFSVHLILLDLFI